MAKNSLDGETIHDASISRLIISELQLRISKLNRLINSQENSLDSSENNQAMSVCEKEGHDFGEETDGWVRHECTSREDVKIEINYVQENCLVNHFQYSRVCKRCGFQEVFKRDREPEAVIKQEAMGREMSQPRQFEKKLK